jgi:hypothetical protein
LESDRAIGPTRFWLPLFFYSTKEFFMSMTYDAANSASNAGRSAAISQGTSEATQQQLKGSNRDMTQSSSEMNDSGTLAGAGITSSGSSAAEAASDRGVARRIQDGVIAERKAVADSVSKAFG